MNKCENCNNLINEIEKLRIELTEVRDKYSMICERLWNISHKKR